MLTFIIQIKNFNLHSNGSSSSSNHNGVANNHRQNGKSSTMNTNLRMNSQSLINIANGVRSNGHQFRAQSPAPPPPPLAAPPLPPIVPNMNGSSSSSQTSYDRLKEEIMQEFRQELIQFKRELLNGEYR